MPSDKHYPNSLTNNAMKRKQIVAFFKPHAPSNKKMKTETKQSSAYAKQADIEDEFDGKPMAVPKQEATTQDMDNSCNKAYYTPITLIKSIITGDIVPMYFLDGTDDKEEEEFKSDQVKIREESNATFLFEDEMELSCPENKPVSNDASKNRRNTSTTAYLRIKFDKTFDLSSANFLGGTNRVDTSNKHQTTLTQ